MDSEDGEEILYQMKTELQVFLFDVLYLCTCELYFSKAM